MDILHLLSIIGSLGGAIGTTILVLCGKKYKTKGIWVWTASNAAMLIFTYTMGYTEQVFMWTYYEIVNVCGLLNAYTDIGKRLGLNTSKED